MCGPITHHALLWLVGREHLSSCAAPLFRLHSYLDVRGRRRRLRVVDVWCCTRCDRVLEVCGPEFVGDYPFSASCRVRGGPHWEPPSPSPGASS